MERGRLVSLEGIDGVGKSTCADILINHLDGNDGTWKYLNRKTVPETNDYIKQHMQCLYDIMWGKGKVFSKAPNEPYNGLSKEHWLHLMIAWYCAFEQHAVFPLINKGISVIIDGYIYKEIVKSIYSSGSFKTQDEFAFLYKPDIVFYLTASPEDCVRNDSYTNRIESGTFVGMENDFVKHQNKMKKIYDRLAMENNWIIIKRDEDALLTCNKILSHLNC